ncbi:hypothetical protein ETH_00041825, partial [Eimeria tenella]
DRVDLIWYIKAACEDKAKELKEGLSSMRLKLQQQPKQQQQQQQQLHPAGGAATATGGPMGGPTGNPHGGGPPERVSEA